MLHQSESAFVRAPRCLPAMGLVLCACFAGWALAQAQVPPPANRSAAPAKELAPADLVRLLRAGGLVVYFRHAATDFSQNDANSRGPEDCANQRNLTDRGRDDARRIGAAIKAIGIPVQRVLASPTCRTVETARLIFGQAEATTTVRSRNTDPNDATRFEPLKQLFQTRVAPRSVLGIVSHGNPFFAVAGSPYLAEGEGAVLRPSGDDWEIVARLRVDQWEQLERFPAVP